MTIEKHPQNPGYKIYFRIPFTWYWIAKIKPHPDGEKALFCLAIKAWKPQYGYYWKPIL